MKKKTERAPRDIGDILFDFFVYPEKYPVIHMLVVIVLSIAISITVTLIALSSTNH